MIYITIKEIDFFACFSFLNGYFCFLCYFFVSQILVLWMFFVTFAHTVINYQEGSHGTYKEI